MLDLDNLEDRRKKICLKFATKCVKNNKFKHWFPKKPKNSTRSHEIYIKPSGQTKRYLTSSIPYLTNILNEHEAKKVK